MRMWKGERERERETGRKRDCDRDWENERDRERARYGVMTVYVKSQISYVLKIISYSTIINEDPP